MRGPRRLVEHAAKLRPNGRLLEQHSNFGIEEPRAGIEVHRTDNDLAAVNDDSLCVKARC